MAFASRFLNSNEERYSINELELLGEIWAIEYFKYYLFGKNLKPIVPKSKWHPHKACQEPNEEIQIDFGGPIINDKHIHFLTCIDRYSKYPTARIFDNANGVNVVKFLRDYA